MPTNQTTPEPENQTSKKTSLPPIPQNPTQETPIPNSDSEPPAMPPEAPEAPRDGFGAESSNIPSLNSPLSDSSNEIKTEEKQASSKTEALADKENEPNFEPVSEPEQVPEPPAEAEAKADKKTAQMGRNEPLTEPEKEPNLEPKSEKPEVESNPTEEVNEQKAPERTNEPKPEPKSDLPKLIPLIIPVKNLARELIVKARNAIQFRKRKKLDKVMSLFDKKKNGSTSSPRVTNDEVEKFLHVSDATATRYLSQLEKEGKIKQVGKTGKGVSYSRI